MTHSEGKQVTEHHLFVFKTSIILRFYSYDVVINIIFITRNDLLPDLAWRAAPSYHVIPCYVPMTLASSLQPYPADADKSSGICSVVSCDKAISRNK